MHENWVHIFFMWVLYVDLSLRKIFCNRLCYTRILNQIETDYESTLLLSPSPTFPLFMPDCGIAKDEFKRVCETHLDTIWLLHTNTTNLQLTIHLLATEIKTQNTRLKNVLEVAKVQNGNLHCCLYWEFCNVALYMSSEHNCETKEDWMNSMTSGNQNEIKVKTRKFRCTRGGGEGGTYILLRLITKPVNVDLELSLWLDLHWTFCWYSLTHLYSLY